MKDKSFFVHGLKSISWDIARLKDEMSHFVRPVAAAEERLEEMLKKIEKILEGVY